VLGVLALGWGTYFFVFRGSEAAPVAFTKSTDQKPTRETQPTDEGQGERSVRDMAEEEEEGERAVEFRNTDEEDQEKEEKQFRDSGEEQKKKKKKLPSAA
jgi:hypothetical protein